MARYVWPKHHCLPGVSLLPAKCLNATDTTAATKLHSNESVANLPFGLRISTVRRLRSAKPAAS